MPARETNSRERHIARVMDAHSAVKTRIEARLSGFAGMWSSGTDREIFMEMAFCLLTPQSRARACWTAVTDLHSTGLLYAGGPEDIAGVLASRGVRFHNVKTGRLVRARGMFSPPNPSVRAALDGLEPAGMREWLVANVDGMGYKEASHFLRNVGKGEGMAILDRHILRNMQRLGVLESIPGSISGARYRDLEGRFIALSEELGIPPDHLDLVLWYMETGDIFK